ncbi:MAG TPA: hypothetical protein VL294_13290 [Pseudolysinimonas sp.]|nr:hypothetical protein [Pseudolysinimonas sp.]
MDSTQGGNRGSRVTIAAALAAAFLILAGCSATDPSATHSPVAGSPIPAPQQDGSSYTIDETSGGFIYTDVPSGYVVTFPQRPTVQPLSNNDTDQPANFAAAESTSSEFASIGQVLNKTPELRNQLMGFVQSLNPTGQVNASSYTLGGLDAVWAEFTTGESPGLPSSFVGQQGETVMAGDGHNFYQLVAIGGSADQRQAFFDSFKRIED